MTEFAVGDIESTAKGTGARANGGKVSFSEIPLHLLAGTARVMMKGARKYAKYNWAKGMPYSVCFDCAMRHMLKWFYCGEELDPETMEHHLDHAICNLIFLKHYIHTYQDGDDRPPVFTDFESELEDFNKQI